MIKKILVFGCVVIGVLSANAQDDMDLLDDLGEDSTEVVYATASYKATRIINSISLENTAEGVTLQWRPRHLRLQGGAVYCGHEDGKRTT